MTDTLKADAKTDPLKESLDFLRRMLMIRLFEERVEALRASSEVVGSVHLCNGQEGVPVGTACALQLGDTVFATYRGHGWAIALGAPLDGLFAELLGRAGGVNGGRGGSAQLAVPAVGFYGENAIVGAQTVIALGPALAARYDGSNRVSVAVLGDGAVNQGAVHESFNFASALRLPVVFVCENNHWSELTPTVGMVGNPRIDQRAASYGLTVARVDGNDPTKVRDAVRVAVDQAREGGGPQFLEAATERIAGHYIGDTQPYRSSDERRALEEDEPIARLRRALEPEMAHAIVELEAEVREEVDRAADAALAMPLSSVTDIRTHLYA
jgi:TPP-dependent pyruvate/acetoin dehydrogenase alpha subunit